MTFKLPGPIPDPLCSIGLTMNCGHKEFDFIAGVRRMVRTFFDQLTKDDHSKWVPQEMFSPLLKMELSPLELIGHILNL
jgi:hypothetical protein